MAGAMMIERAHNPPSMAFTDPKEYLAKMAEEEESKRRKEDMVSTFMKLKMRKEERFEALNVSKLMEQWRSLMRLTKSRDLQGDVRVLMDSFNRQVRLRL